MEERWGQTEEVEVWCVQRRVGARGIRALLTWRIQWAAGLVLLCTAWFDSFHLNGGVSELAGVLRSRHVQFKSTSRVLSGPQESRQKKFSLLDYPFLLDAFLTEHLLKQVLHRHTWHRLLLLQTSFYTTFNCKSVDFLPVRASETWARQKMFQKIHMTKGKKSSEIHSSWKCPIILRILNVLHITIETETHYCAAINILRISCIFSFGHCVLPSHLIALAHLFLGRY